MRHTTRRVRLWWLPLVLLTTVHGQDKPLEPPAPVPTTPVQELLDQAAVASNEGDAVKALGLADRALAVAQPVADVAGQALAHRARASQLLKLHRNDETQAAWREAETAWTRIGDGPGQVEALGWQAALVFPGNAARGTELLQRALTLAGTETTRPRAVTSALVDVGRALLDRSRFSEARHTYEAAVALAGAIGPESLELGSSLNGLGNVTYTLGDLSAAHDFHQRALAIREKLAPTSLAVADSLNDLGLVAYRQGDLSTARDYAQRALAIREKLAPNSLEVAASLTNLGNVAFDQGDLSTARDFYQRALAIQETLAPNSLYVARSLNNLGSVAAKEGDLSAARDYAQRALAIFDKLAPNSLTVATSLGNLGSVAAEQGDLSAARDYFQRALAIFDKLAPNSLTVAANLNNLGNVASDQGDQGAARDFYLRALAIFDELAPNSLTVAASLTNLGNVASDQGDLSAARDYAQRALAIQEKLAPNSLDVDASLTNLGVVAFEQDDLSVARDFLQRALAIGEKLAPNSLDVATSLDNLGSVAAEQGDLSAARDYEQRALAIREKLAPNSVDLASTLRDLGHNSYDRGDRASAAQLTARAWAIVQAQAVVVAGDEARQAFESQYEPIASQLVRFQTALGQTDQAFVTLEEGRAQALLQLLAERGVARRLAPADVWHRYELAQAVSDQAGKALEDAGAAEASAPIALAADRAQGTERARRAYTQARVETEGRWGDVRHAIQAVVPTPLGAADARRALPPDTVVAAFVVGDKESTLFVVRRDGPTRAFPIALSLKDLAARVDLVRRSVSGEADTRGVKLVSSERVSDDARVTAARELYQKLFPAGARDAIGKARRVLLSPDGVLWDLPFAALVINDHGTPRYLGLEKPLVYAQSLTTFAQAIQATAPMRASRPTALVIGNPLYDNALRAARLIGSQGTTVLPSGAVDHGGPIAPGERALLTRDGASPAPLPYAEAEANQVAALYGAHASTGVEPTEAWFRQHAGGADIIHLATHGYFNPFRATSSGLLLAVPEHAPAPGDTDNDGALQAWEIMSLQLRADVVVLSACETGVGAKVRGEGLVGLTRAFQVAGAASIVATQWSVADKSTATGMVAFHQNLLKGMTKDEALRQAMRKLANDPTTASPYYWAPFVLVGDFRPLRASVPR